MSVRPQGNQPRASSGRYAGWSHSAPDTELTSSPLDLMWEQIEEARRRQIFAGQEVALLTAEAMPLAIAESFPGTSTATFVLHPDATHFIFDTAFDEHGTPIAEGPAPDTVADLMANLGKRATDLFPQIESSFGTAIRIDVDTPHT